MQSPDEAALSDFDIITIDITDSPGNSILFDVIVSAEVEIAETVRRNRETDGIEQWFRISCRADLDDGIQNFQINSVSIYNKYRESKLGRLSEYLVPIIEKEQFDDVATEFLNEFCPEALSTPMPIPVDEVVKRMGLKVKEIQLTKHFTIFGHCLLYTSSKLFFLNECFGSGIICHLTYFCIFSVRARYKSELLNEHHCFFALK